MQIHNLSGILIIGRQIMSNISMLVTLHLVYIKVILIT
jgi:hypothetical protein